MAGARRVIKRAAIKTATGLGYTRPQAKAYARGAVAAIKPRGVTAESKTYRKQIAGAMTTKQVRKVRRYDRTAIAKPTMRSRKPR